MKSIKKPLFKRYAFSYEEIKSELQLIKHNFQCLNPEEEIIIDVHPEPDKVEYDGREKEFNIHVTIIYDI